MIVRHSLSYVVSNTQKVYPGNLEHYYRLLLANTPNNPYHDAQHGVDMLYTGHDAGLYHWKQGLITPRQFRNLDVSHLMHDYANTGKSGPNSERPGWVPDSVNIELAVKGLRDHAEEIDKPYLDEIEVIIRASEYPYPPHLQEVGLFGDIIRDSDLVQVLGVDWVKKLCGLADEWDLPRIELFEMQPNFLAYVKAHLKTEWARKRFCKDIDKRKTDAAKLLNIMRTYDEDPMAMPKPYRFHI